MFKLKELVHLVLAVVLFSFLIWSFSDPGRILFSFIVSSVVILVNVLAKKLTGRYLHLGVEMKIWELKRWGYYQRSELKKGVPVGVFIPFLVAFVSIGAIKVLTFLQTEVSTTIRRVVKKRGGFDRYAELTEWDNWKVIASGMFFNLGLVFVYLIFKNDLTLEIAKYSVYYVMWNLLPIGKLDGMKILSVGFKWWFFVWILAFLALGLLVVF